MKKLLILFILLSIILTACSKKEVNNGKSVALKLNLRGSTFEEQNINSKKTANISAVGGADYSPNKSSMSINNEYYMDIELQEDNTDKLTNNSIIRKDGNFAVLVNRPVPNEVRYKMTVFNADGTYNTERNYIVGSEGTTAEILLDRGNRYTFIVYSVGSETVLPDITFANPANRTLETATVAVTNVATSNIDLMYYKWDSPIIDVPQYEINATLKHVFSRLTVSIDATATGYTLERPSSSFSQNYNNAVLKLSDASILSRTTAVTPNINYPSTNQSTLVSSPFIINAANNTNSTLTISTLKIGEISNSNPIVVSGLRVVPGTSYTLKLTVVPEDAILNANAVRIGGQVWQRLNIGANSATPENYGQSTFGGYYQYGYNQYIYTGTMTAGQRAFNGTGRTGVAFWNGNPAAIEIRDLAPLRGTDDPCPTGFRIPSESELQRLLDNTNIQNSTFADNSYNTGIRLVSKRNSSVRIMFPAQGRISVTGNSTPYSNAGIANRGTAASVSTSYASNNVRSFYTATASSSAMSRTTANRSSYVGARPVRCIQGN
ncbi:FISUMP domain-containing protein [Sphingobacterium rhinopitheci]|uniref:FISUMP domain-containing protein n=1 Tax=Sphingobacterium rhinopitheci TaxID=2781960 RepID=UPI001F528540|nr:FISUMP domain-containing protein [Sphingobacterium rhinopitheci]MCI0922084.1 hypothetical protein [Sphingobacterium rhinopitheci]